jgi:uncharacterized protein YciI
MNRLLNGKHFATLLAIALLPAGQSFGQEAQAREQYVYVLQVAPQYQEEASWTAAENAVVAQHFERLASAVKSGQVIIAGRTMEPLDKTFGLVIFEADSETAAQEFMRTDPAVMAGLMNATLHPYAVALQRK